MRRERREIRPLPHRHAPQRALRRKPGIVLSNSIHFGDANAYLEVKRRLHAESDHEELLLPAEETTPLQSWRVPVFPPRFSPTLAVLPQHVARHALSLIGRLAAGEPAAFAGMRRLRASREICRVRVTADDRFLFKPLAHRLEVLDVINRKDFEKWLKTLN